MQPTIALVLVLLAVRSGKDWESDEKDRTAAAVSVSS